MSTFKVGTTYETRSIGDHNCVFSYRVVGRSAKFITIEGGVGRNGQGERRRVGIYEYDGSECAKPEGTYSMSPTIRADRETA